MFSAEEGTGGKRTPRTLHRASLPAFGSDAPQQRRHGAGQVREGGSCCPCQVQQPHDGAKRRSRPLLGLWRRPAPAAPDGDYDAEEGLTFETSKGIRVVTSFDDMRLKDLLMRGIYQFGFEKPSAIQQRAIIPIAEGRDVIAQAQSGTGKTSMIAVAMCQRVDTSMRECVLHKRQALLLRSACSLLACSKPLIL